MLISRVPRRVWKCDSSLCWSLGFSVFSGQIPYKFMLLVSRRDEIAECKKISIRGWSWDEFKKEPSSFCRLHCPECFLTFVSSFYSFFKIQIKYHDLCTNTVSCITRLRHRFVNACFQACFPGILWPPQIEALRYTNSCTFNTYHRRAHHKSAVSTPWV